MLARQKIINSGQQLENIFLNNRFFLLLQMPFENVEQFARLNQKLAERGFVCKKLSRTDLAKQLITSKSSFIHCSNSNYIITEAEGQKINTTWSELGPVFRLVQENGGVLFFVKTKVNSSGFEVWHDQPRLTHNSSLTTQTPLSFHLTRFIKTRSVIPYLSSNNARIINLILVSAHQARTHQ